MGTLRTAQPDGGPRTVSRRWSVWDGMGWDGAGVRDACMPRRSVFGSVLIEAILLRDDFREMARDADRLQNAVHLFEDVCDGDVIVCHRILILCRYQSLRARQHVNG